MDKDLAEQVADIAHRVVASGAVSANGHGNVSVRVPGAQEMYFTAGPSLRGHPASVAMHTAPCTKTTQTWAASCTPTRRTPPPTRSRGSAEAVVNIRAAVLPGVPAVLLANHGVLIFHRTPDLAILAGSVVEESAQAGLNCQGLGGPVEIPPDLRAAALQRAMVFDSQGTVRA